MQNPSLSFLMKVNILVHLATLVPLWKSVWNFFKLNHITGVFNFFPEVIYFKTAGPEAAVF